MKPATGESGRMGADVGGYERRSVDGWRLWLHPAWRDAWRVPLWGLLNAMPSVIRSSRHAQTALVRLADDAREQSAYLKRYHPADLLGQLKDALRPSRAFNALRMSVALAADGFGVPHVLAAGEQRRLRVVRAAFLLTQPWPGHDLRELPAALAAQADDARRRLKRTILAAVGAEIGRFHAAGYLHGDLVVTNVLVRWQPDLSICLLDHDRTRRSWPVARRAAERRNLVQLNRHRIAGVNDSDRLRLLLSYGRARGWPAATLRREARRIARKTSIARAAMTAPTHSET
jgi:tRNA A-37 threonylcarbamoyl transferase component Bud32